MGQMTGSLGESGGRLDQSTGSPPFPRPPRSWASWFAPSAVVLALLSALATFLVLTGMTPIAPTHEVVVTVLLANALIAAVLIAVLAWEFYGLVRARRRGRAGARLHVRIAMLFGVVAIVPAILVAVIASITLDRGLDRWFSDRTRGLLTNSINIAQAYVRDYSFATRSDLESLASEIARLRPMFDENRDRFRQVLTGQAAIRGIPAAMMVRGDHSLVERAEINIGREFVVPPNLDLRRASFDDPILALAESGDYLHAVIPIKGYEDTFLYIVRPIDPKVIQYLRQTQESVVEYQSLESRRFGVQVAFALMYAVISLILLLSAVWLGLNFANRLVAPIRRLITAADLVASGNLFVQVPVRRGEGDLASLGDSFNSMTQELRTQRDDIIRARDQIDTRRRFTEAVLAGIGAGVIGIDPDGRITILNRSAERLIGQSEDAVIGHAITEAIPEVAQLIAQARDGIQRVQGTVTLTRNGRERTINVRVTTEASQETEHGYVITLDDITELVSAQRTSAWADVARRIAHEIKNPLTPIQLSAERLRRKFGKNLTEDRDVFEQCTDTIIRQVGDIGRMVDEFSSFARMPKPVVESQDLAETVRQAVFLMRVGNPEVTFDTELPNGPVLAQFDRRLISQALTNLLKNAVEAIGGVPTEERGPGRVLTRVNVSGDFAVIDITDNGSGLPKENRERLLEPYVTTREKGTGLGLAIVAKIFEDHGGRIELHDAPKDFGEGRGAWIRATFLIKGKAAAERRPASDSVSVSG
jgi:two-component system, NtrC family, nitrogen regulation sensor histidine kinase NtrY